jgi:hypothetical protein
MRKLNFYKINKHNKKVVLRWFIILFIVLPAIPFILSTVGLIAYSFWPRDFSESTLFTIDEKTQYITLSAHGVKDSPISWSDQLMSLMRKSPPQQITNLHQQTVSIDWQDFSDNVFICSTAGKQLGFEIGTRIAKQTNIKAVHVIGHSCGAFVALGICQGVKSGNIDIIVQSTYLDPVSVYGGVFWDYGLDNFGSCANFSDSYIDTEDGVPGSNQVLQHSVTFNVTDIKRTRGYKIPPHVWPTKYYIESYKNEEVPIFFNTEGDIKNSFPQSPMTKNHSN